MIIYGPKARFAAQKGNIRDLRPVWLLEELGVPYEHRLIDSAKGGNETPEFVRMNPFKRFPVMVDGDLTLFESAAICLHIADKHGRFVPPPKTRERSLHNQWLFAAVATLEQHVYAIVRADLFMPQDGTADAFRAVAEKSLQVPLAAVDRHLAERSFLVGDDFTVADLTMSAAVFHAHRKGLLGGFPELTKYLERMYARPAYQRALARNGGI